MLFASRRNRIFLDAGAFHCKKALVPVTIQLDQHCMLLTSSCKRIFLGAGALGCFLLSSNGTCIQIVCYLLEDATEYSPRQAPSVVVCCQMAPASATSQLDQNHIVFTSSQKRMFLERGTFRWPEWIQQPISIFCLISSKVLFHCIENPFTMVRIHTFEYAL
jgi:hypothetical protein